MRILPKSIIVLLLLLCSLFALGKVAFATTGVSIAIPVFGNPVENGHIVSVIEGNYILSFSSEDPSMFGVVTDDPVLSLQDLTVENTYFVTTNGEALVKVTGLNGNIKEGDFITASKIPGVGMKATRSGQVLGVALQKFEPQDPNELGEILVFINITSAFVGERADQDLLSLLRSGFQVPFITPLTSLRYILAALVSLVAFFIGFSSFGKISTNSIEALGRNPLASRIIKSAIFLNFVFTVGIMGVGLVVAYLILTF